MLAPVDRPAGFHEGELAVQRRAGAVAEAARLSGMLAPGDLSGGFARFLAGRTFAALAARDDAGRLWVSPLSGPAGFLVVTGPATLVIRAAPVAGDPLHGLPAGQPAGLIVIEFAARRRVRVNGTLSAVGPGGLTIDVDQAYGNCPKYIQPRLLTPAREAAPDGPVRRGGRLAEADIELVRWASTFFIGTAHPVRGADCSHRGGPPGFVREAGGELRFPDYHGNSMFNTLGNLAVDPAAALLFPDFATGRTVQLSGTAAVEWPGPGPAGREVESGRTVRFAPRAIAAGRLLRVRASAG
jgi:predicted pyridoxine 5'-phosphate oxidase superfamily flavin-nucleotide-binding protein